MMEQVTVLGGRAGRMRSRLAAGQAGDTRAAWCEMKPEKSPPRISTPWMAELVCSNSACAATV